MSADIHYFHHRVPPEYRDKAKIGANVLVKKPKYIPHWLCFLIDPYIGKLGSVSKIHKKTGQIWYEVTFEDIFARNVFPQRLTDRLYPESALEFKSLGILEKQPNLLKDLGL